MSEGEEAVEADEQPTEEEQQPDRPFIKMEAEVLLREATHETIDTRQAEQTLMQAKFENVEMPVTEIERRQSSSIEVEKKIVQPSGETNRDQQGEDAERNSAKDQEPTESAADSSKDQEVVEQYTRESTTKDREAVESESREELKAETLPQEETEAMDEQATAIVPKIELSEEEKEEGKPTTPAILLEAIESPAVKPESVAEKPAVAAAASKDKPPKLLKTRSAEKEKTKRPSTVDVKHKPTRPVYPNGPLRAKRTDEAKIARELRKVPPPHDYFGYIYSAESQRPPNYYYKYTLPIYKQPLPRQHICITGEKVPMEKIHKEKSFLNKALPLSTLKIKWRLSRLSTVYKLEDLYAYLTVFGPIEGVYLVSVNSAMVVFADVESARAVIMCPCLGFPWDPLIAEWMEPRMNNFGFYSRYLRFEEPILQPTS